MLKRYSVENFSSFRERNVLDFTAGRVEENSSHRIGFDGVKLLKSAVIYGANASGKSNLIKSMDFAKKVILGDLGKVDTYKKHFRLDNDSLNNVSRFEFEIEIDECFFSYGFSSILQTKEIVEEWFYEIGKKVPSKIFERNKNNISFGKRIKEDSGVKSRFDIYSADMKNQSSQLFLSEVASKEIDNSELLRAGVFNNVYKWFKEQLIIIYPQSKYMFPILNSGDDGIVGLLKKYLIEFDTGIKDISTIENDIDDEKDLPDDFRSMIEEQLKVPDAKVMAEYNKMFFNFYKDSKGNILVQKLGLIHSDNSREAFDLKDESDGTRRLFDLIPLIARFQLDATIVIDEFDQSLHPKLTKQFFDLFFSFENSKSQLVISTHESTLLDLDKFRRDEIWFVEKDQSGASKLFPLNKFKVRYDSKVDKAYLLGRYGAVPFFKTFDETN